jgi:hypothetical protein
LGKEHSVAPGYTKCNNSEPYNIAPYSPKEKVSDSKVCSLSIPTHVHRFSRLCFNQPSESTIPIKADVDSAFAIPPLLAAAEETPALLVLSNTPMKPPTLLSTPINISRPSRQKSGTSFPCRLPPPSDAGSRSCRLRRRG